jgi:hypothetical protein
MKHNYFTVMAKMIFAGFEFHREIDSCIEEWIKPATGKVFRINKTSEYISQEELLSILNQAGLSLEVFKNI